MIPVKVTITDDAIHLAPPVGRRGAVARFVLINQGRRPHTFAFGLAKHPSGTQAGFVRTLRPREQTVVSLFLDYRGTIRWAGTMAADRAKSRMKGTFRIT